MKHNFVGMSRIRNKSHDLCLFFTMNIEVFCRVQMKQSYSYLKKPGGFGCCDLTINNELLL